MSQEKEVNDSEEVVDVSVSVSVSVSEDLIFESSDGTIYQKKWVIVVDGGDSPNFSVQKNALISGQEEASNELEQLEEIKKVVLDIVYTGGIFDSKGRHLCSYLEILESIIAGCHNKSFPALPEINQASKILSQIEKEKLCPYSEKIYSFLMNKDTIKETDSEEEKSSSLNVERDQRLHAISVLNLANTGTPGVDNLSGYTPTEEDIIVIATAVKITDSFLRMLVRKTRRGNIETGSNPTGIHFIRGSYLHNSGIRLPPNIRTVVGEGNNFNLFLTSIESGFPLKAKIWLTSDGRLLRFALGDYRDHGLIARLLEKIVKSRFDEGKGLSSKICVGYRSIMMVSVIKAVLCDELRLE